MINRKIFQMFETIKDDRLLKGLPIFGICTCRINLFALFLRQMLLLYCFGKLVNIFAYEIIHLTKTD